MTQYYEAILKHFFGFSYKLCNNSKSNSLFEVFLVMFAMVFIQVEVTVAIALWYKPV